MLVVARPSAVAAAGPWSGVVLDAHTGVPVEGAVVVAIWNRRARGHPAIGLGTPGLVAFEEVVTDAQGRFTLPARVLVNPPLFFPIEGPDLTIFKGGYGGWRFRGDREDLAQQRAVIQIRPLPTPDERLKYIDDKMRENDPRWGWLQDGRGPGRAHDLPYTSIRRYEAAINEERALLGLPRIGLGYPGLGKE
jgi:hypothetical protein